MVLEPTSEYFSTLRNSIYFTRINSSWPPPLAVSCASVLPAQRRAGVRTTPMHGTLPGYHPLPRLPAQVRAQLAKQLGAASRHAQPARLPVVVI